MAWSNRRLSIAEAARRQLAYDKYIRHEVVPWIEQDCRTPGIPLATMGFSFGAYHALHTLLRSPDIFRWSLGLSGFYDISTYFNGYYDENCLRCNPRDYLPANMSPEYRHLLNRCEIYLICGQGAWERVHWTRDFSQFLTDLGIKHHFHLWGHDASHDWDSWKRELNEYLPRLFG